MNLEIIQNLDHLILIIVGFLLVFGLLLIIGGFRHLFHRKWVTASLEGLSGSSLSLLGLLLISIASNLYSYQRLTIEQQIAELHFTKLDEQRFEVELAFLTDSNKQRFVISGDEWQIDARILKWQGWAQILGLDAQYRLERISGRYSDIEQEQTATRTVYSLNERDQIDYWRIAKQYQQWIPWVDAYYGSATYLPMSDQARYALSLTQSGLIARPLNTETENTIKFW